VQADQRQPLCRLTPAARRFHATQPDLVRQLTLPRNARPAAFRADPARLSTKETPKRLFAVLMLPGCIAIDDGLVVIAVHDGGAFVEQLAALTRRHYDSDGEVLIVDSTRDDRPVDQVPVWLVSTFSRH
jgi:hypothetical protein